MSAAFTQYAQNKFIDALRGQAIGVPANWYPALHIIKGVWTASTAYSVGDYVVPVTANGRLYKCTTAGTSGVSEPTWPTTNASTVTNGGAVFTEQTTAMYGGTFPTEAAYTGYARPAIAASLAALAGTQGAGTTTASSGSSGVTSNNSAASYGAPTAGAGYTVGVVVWWDASSAGNAWFWGVMTNPQAISNGASAPSAAAGALQLGFNNAV